VAIEGDGDGSSPGLEDYKAVAEQGGANLCGKTHSHPRSSMSSGPPNTDRVGRRPPRAGARLMSSKNHDAGSSFTGRKAGTASRCGCCCGLRTLGEPTDALVVADAGQGRVGDLAAAPQISDRWVVTELERNFWTSATGSSRQAFANQQSAEAASLAIFQTGKDKVCVAFRDE